MNWSAGLFAANVVLEAAIERIIVGEVYCDIPLGLYVIRGENVVLIGEIVSLSLNLVASREQCCARHQKFVMLVARFESKDS
jgi:hypothetical protein